MFKVFYDCQAMQEVDGVALLTFPLTAPLYLLCPFHRRTVPNSGSQPCPAAPAAAANRKKQSTRVFKINCYDGFC